MIRTITLFLSICCTTLFSQVPFIRIIDWSISSEVNFQQDDVAKSIILVNQAGGGSIYYVFITSTKPVVFHLRIPGLPPTAGNGTMPDQILNGEIRTKHMQAIAQLSKSFIAEVMNFCANTPRTDSTNLDLAFREVQIIIEQPRKDQGDPLVLISSDGCSDPRGKEECLCPSVTFSVPTYLIGWTNNGCKPSQRSTTFRSTEEFFDYFTNKQKP